MSRKVSAVIALVLSVIILATSFVSTAQLSIDVKPHERKIVEGTLIALSPTSLYEVSYIYFFWDNNPSMRITDETATIIAPSAGNHKLYVFVAFSSGPYKYSHVQCYNFTITAAAVDNTPPSISVSPSSGTLEPEESITITATDNSGIAHIGYALENNETTPAYSNSVTVYAPTLAGTYTLKVYAKDNSPRYNWTGWKICTFTVVKR